MWSVLLCSHLLFPAKTSWALIKLSGICHSFSFIYLSALIADLTSSSLNCWTMMLTYDEFSELLLTSPKCSACSDENLTKLIMDENKYLLSTFLKTVFWYFPRRYSTIGWSSTTVLAIELSWMKITVWSWPYNKINRKLLCRVQIPQTLNAV